MSNILVLNTPEEFLRFRKNMLEEKIGFVPTMGALHAGHADLLKKSVQENDVTILSIFVNPTQFNDQNDFQKYPKTFEADLKLAEECGVRVIFAPQFKDMYPDEYRYKVSENLFSKELCGKSRPGHFDGVLTVVMKLFNIVRPHTAYFGEKDFQQLKLIEDMVQSFFLNIKIVHCPTVRETNGLAMSSRNTRLSPEGKSKAALIYKALIESKTSSEAQLFLQNSGFEIDYIVDQNNRRYAAVFLEGVRLIDNVKI